MLIEVYAAKLLSALFNKKFYYFKLNAVLTTELKAQFKIKPNRKMNNKRLQNKLK